MLVVAATAAVTERRRVSRAGGATESESARIEREIDSLIAEQENETLAAIDHALHLLETTPDTYGHCEECGETISTDRLDITPWITRCVEHTKGVFAF